MIYDGIHYDPLVAVPKDSAPAASEITKFATNDVDMLPAAVAVAAEAHGKRQFTNLAGLTLRCLVCQSPLMGQKAAQEHATKTGHTNFSEY